MQPIFLPVPKPLPAEAVRRHRLEAIKVIIDSSGDDQRCAYVALIIEDGQKPRLIYGTGRNVGTGHVEYWGLNRVLRRLADRFGPQRPLLVFTDRMDVAQSRSNARVRYCWIPRTNRLMHHLDRMANALRKSL